MRTLLAPLPLAAVAATAPAPAAATWMGLPDGDYAVTLQCTFSSVIDCSQIIAGSITVSGSGLSAMAFDINGESFVGDPQDSVVDGTLVDTEGSSLSHSPLSFLSLRLITAGSISQFQTGDLWWVYCNNSGPLNCTPNTTGLWSARLVGTVNEPPALAVAALGLAAAFGAARRGCAGAQRRQRFRRRRDAGANVGRRGRPRCARARSSRIESMQSCKK